MTHSTSRFVGLAAAFVAGTLASSPTAIAQDSPARGSQTGAFNAVLRSGVSGVVRDRTGRPQIGALVELLNANYSVLAQTFTDDNGRYALPRLGAGVYQVKVSNSFFLPTVRPNLRLLANTRVVVNLTLSTLYQALQWLPAEPRDRNNGSSEDWDWTLRLAANRPLLRMLDPATARAASAGVAPAGDESSGPVMIEAAAPERGSTAAAHQVVIRSGFTRFGEGGVAQQIVWGRGEGESGTLLLAAQSALDERGDLGRLSTSAAYRSQLSPDRTMTTIATLSDRPMIHSGSGDGLTTMRVRSASTVAFGDLGEISAGTELVGARMGDSATVLGDHPFATVLVHAGDSTIAYRIATALSMAGADQMESEAAADAPALSEVAGQLQMEQGLHQALSISRHFGSQARGRFGEGHFGEITGELSVFHDTLAHPVLQGLVAGDEAAIDTNNVLYDPGTGTIAVSGEGYSGGGVLAMLRDQLSPGTWLSFRYAMGEAATMQAAGTVEQALPSFKSERSSMLAVAAETRLPVSNTVIRGGYRWQPVSTLTRVAPFEADVPDAYVSLYIRQPLHLERLGAGRVEAILDVRNLLAQGYRPFLSQDGTTVYFAQAQRCIAAGISFSF